MRTFLLIITLLLVQTTVYAADANIELKSLRVNLNNQASLQRGAQLFMNYCSGCHSLKYLRYTSMAKGLGLTTFDGSIDKDLLMNNLIFTSSKPHEPIEVAMPDVDARQWFGRMPPDLTLTSRERGPNWIYTYLKSFYKDETRPFGANNLLVPDVSMPNVLVNLQGEVIAAKNKGHSGGQPPLKLVLIEPGSMTQQEFDSALKDLVTFLVYVAEPHKLERYSLGVWVLMFLMVLAVFAYLLKKAYWKNI
jgi:ubiquinol-cytochrome c reductase cytochrome c1 subunit